MRLVKIMNLYIHTVPEHNVYMQLSWKRKVHLEEHVWMIHVGSFQKLQLLSRQGDVLNIYHPIGAMLDAKNLINLSDRANKLKYFIEIFQENILYFKETINIVFTVKYCKNVVEVWTTL